MLQRPQRPTLFPYTTLFRSDLHFGQAQAGLGIGGGDAVVAREAEFESAADRSAVDGGDPRLAAGLDAPVEQRELAALLEHHGGDRKSTRLNSSHSQISYAVF